MSDAPASPPTVPSEAPPKAPPEAPSDSGHHAGAVTRWLWRDYLRRHSGLLFVAFLLMAFEGAMLGALSYLIKPMFDQVLVAGKREAITWVALIIFGVFAARAVASFGHRVLMTRVGQTIAARLQSNLVAHILTLDGSFFQANTPGTLIERTRGDTLAAATVWNTVLAAFGRDLISLVALFAVAISVDWRWTLVAVAAVPIIVFPVALLHRLVRRTERSARQAAARISSRLDEIFHGVETIKLSGTEARETARFDGTLTTFVRTTVRSVAGQAAMVSLSDIVAGLGFMGVLFYGGNQIIDGTKTVGEFMSFFTAMALVFEPLRRLTSVSGAWQAAMASIERLYGIFMERPTIVSPAAPAALARPANEADVVLDEIEFGYGDTLVLKGLSFTAKAGQTTALVGASGAGKSTVFNLLTRLADPSGGAVRIGGTDTKTLSLPELRGLFSVVSQEAMLFDESLRDNITLGAETDEKRLRGALKAAHAAEFLPALPEGLDTMAGPRGSALSGGQRQRVAIARALLRRAPILLLDEATSALDAKSEQYVQEALDLLSKGRTTLVIAHRLSTVREADKIVVMDQGRVIDEGTHEELLARGGKYAELHALQFAESATRLRPGKSGPAGAGLPQADSEEGRSGSGPLGAASRALGSVLGLFRR